MIYDLNEIKIDPFKDKQFDVCIIGGGIAGITLAMYLNKSLNILLLEAGGEDYSEESQEVYKGKNIGHEYFDLNVGRARFLGGTSNWWGGWSAPLSSFDFKKRDYVKHSGWPIDKTDLDPYEKEARSIVELPDKPRSINYKGWTDVLENSDEYLKGFKFQWSVPPINFRDKYKSELENRSNITCAVNANLTDITLLDNLSSIKNIEIKNYRNKVFGANAKTYILATGGIENARLLLNFNKQCKNGIGNDNDLVGRFFSDHLHFITGEFIVEDHVEEIFSSKKEKQSDRYEDYNNFLVPSEKFQKNDEILNFGLRIEPLGSIYQKPFQSKLKDIICTWKWLENITEEFRDQKTDCTGDGHIRTVSEQAPNPKSRITLGQEDDKLGLRRPILNWQLQKIDKTTQRKASIRFAKMFAKQNLGRVKIQEWVFDEDAWFPGFDLPEYPERPQELGGNHHMCTTRMSASPSEGVVDKNQKVFGVDNLYVAGSSVFTTVGHVNSTFPIIQMTLRLADHINTRSAST